jgi:hypothetical protein
MADRTDRPDRPAWVGWHRYDRNDPLWYEKERASRRFRHHVRTQSNPNGRIEREPCYFCGEAPTQAHHPDHAYPYRVVWVCLSHHRMVDHGALAVPEAAIRDYISVVRTRPGAWHSGRVAADDATDNDCPF